MSSIDILENEVVEAAETELLKAVVKTSFARANQMITDLLDANRIGAGNPVVLKDVDDLCFETFLRDTITGSFYRDRSRFSIEPGPDVRVRWSRRDILRVFENLAGNAIKYGDRERPITVRWSLRDQAICWSVHNWGKEIPEEDQFHLFEFLSRSKSDEAGSVTGWGIGLTLVEGLVKAHGGKIGVHSTAVEGTTFTVEMPLRID